ncbi:hypothetical protein GEMRC1_005672 [Eukaryota sp. GEM-RC1]
MDVVLREGKLLVDQRLHTNDAVIFSIGPPSSLSTFAQLDIKNSFDFDNFEPKILGKYLADVLLACYDPSIKNDGLSLDASVSLPHTNVDVELPELCSKFQLSGFFSNLEVNNSDTTVLIAFNYYQNDCPIGKTIQTENEFGNICIIFNSYDEIVGLFASVTESFRNILLFDFIKLVGLNSNYLNQILNRFTEGSFNLLSFLTQPWSKIIYRDSFNVVRDLLLKSDADDDEADLAVEKALSVILKNDPSLTQFYSVSEV